MIEPAPSVARSGMHAGPLCLRLLKKKQTSQTVEPVGTDAGNVMEVSTRPVLPSNLNTPGFVGISSPTYEHQVMPAVNGGRALLVGSFGFNARAITVFPSTRTTLATGAKSMIGWGSLWVSLTWTPRAIFAVLLIDTDSCTDA